MLNKYSDIYSLGVIFWEISSGRPSFNNNHELNTDEFKKSRIDGERESPINLTPVDYIELYRDAWNEDQQKRPQIKEVISCLEDFELDPVYQDSDYIPEIFYEKNNFISKEINEANEEACLKVINDSSQNQYLFLPEGEILIGRKNSNYIIIKDQEINKKHAKIKNYQGKVDIFSYDSKSIIFINENQLKPNTLHTLKKK
ncbi:kinase-like protein [Gigaspora margarita]|uniref:Kinase-like protein n=1 Tax=Gigaspora margarita TaxID=4874 RepID=A0A8H3WWX4_GIGMA|nr:kinase-like protein [Gigaspora margarita]